MFTLRLRRFWPGAEAPGAFFPRLVSQAIAEPVQVTTSPREPADLEIVEGSPQLRHVMAGRIRHRLTRRRGLDPRWADQSSIVPGATRSIWFTAENVRPPSAGDWSGFLSFDLDPLGGRNAYLPLWLLDLADFNSSGDLRLAPLLESRVPDLSRTRFLCAFIGNPDPMRFHAIERLASVGKVDVFGRSVGRPVTSKWGIARSYRFILCFENDLYPGYVTEKALDGARSGAVPLYRGLDAACSFNDGALLNLAKIASLEDLAEKVRDLNVDDERRARMLAAPVLNAAPSIEAVVQLIRRVIDE